MTSTWTLASPTIPRLLQSRVAPTLLYLPAQTNSEDIHSPPPPVPRRAAFPLPPIQSIMVDISPTTSSPSLYSRPPSHVGHGQAPRSRRTRIYYESEDEVLSEAEPDPRRMSMVAGPRVRKYTDIPWGDEDDTSGPVTTTRTASSGSRTVSPSTSTSTTTSVATARKGFSLFGGSNKPKHLLPSVSGVSLASNQTTSTTSSDERSEPHPLTPKYKLGAAFGSNSSGRAEVTLQVKSHVDDDETSFVVPTKSRVSSDHTQHWIEPPVLSSLLPDRPIVNSASPGFGLISLQAAQERERLRASGRPQPPTQPTPSQQRVHNRYHTEPIPVPSPSTIPVPSPIPTTRPSSKIDYCPATHDDPTPRIKGKKSGLMKYFNRDRADSSSTSHSGNTPIPMPTRPVLESTNSAESKTPSSRAGSVWSEAGSEPIWPKGRTQQPPLPPQSLLTAEIRPQQLELRPVSMTFTRGLPLAYFAEKEDDLSPPVPDDITRLDETRPCAALSGDMATLFKKQLGNARKAWRVQLFELEAQIRELRDELTEARRAGHGIGSCDACGCSCGGVIRRTQDEGVSGSVMDRARVKTAGARGVFGSGSLYEWE